MNERAGVRWVRLCTALALVFLRCHLLRSRRQMGCLRWQGPGAFVAYDGQTAFAHRGQTRIGRPRRPVHSAAPAVRSPRP